MDKTSLDLLPYSRVFSAEPLRPSSSFLPMNLLTCVTAHFWLYLLTPVPVLTYLSSIFKHSAFLAHFRCLFQFGLSWWLSGKESVCQCRRHGFDPWVRKMPCRRKWLPIPGFSPEKSDGHRSLGGYSPWDHKRVEHREGNDNPLQYSCLENPMDGGAW